MLCTYNVENYIIECIKSILDQTVKDFEIVILDDSSTDKTRKLIDGFNDYRIRVFKNNKNIGIAKSRNKCIKLSDPRTEYIFFTDGDCIVSKDWLEQGLNFLKEKECDGVEGRVYYVSEKYKPIWSDKIIKNEKGGLFMTCNMAYKKSFIKKVGGFDANFYYHSDRELALKVTRAGGKLCFNNNMKVYHQKVILSGKEFLKRAERIKYKVYLFKKYGDKDGILWRIINPYNLAILLFPPLVLWLFASERRYDKHDDLKWLLYLYIYNFYERLYVWKEAIKEKVFLI